MGLFTPIWMTDKKDKVPKAIAAVEKVTDLAKLKTIAMSANLTKIRVAACARISDQDTLAEIAKADYVPDVACQLLDRLTGRDDLLMSVAARYASGYDARLLVPLLAMVAEPDIEKLIELTCAIVDHRKRDGKWFRDIDGYDRIMDAVGRTACRAKGDKVRAAALVESCADGWNYALTDAKSADAIFKTVVGWHAPIMRELEAVLPDDPEGLRAYIDSLNQDLVTLADGDQTARTRVIMDCCMLKDALRPYAYDIYQVVNTGALQCDLTVLGDQPGPRQEALNRHEKKCAAWKGSAQVLISLAKEQPDVVYPVRAQLAQAINGAEAQLRDRKQIGYKTISQRVAPDAPDDWTETSKIPDYKYSTKTTPMNMHFPAE